MRCQEFGHTKNYCHKTPVCVKCANNHPTSECLIKSKIKEVVCANCNGNHPASYKGCIVRKQLQEKMFPALREKNLNLTNTPKTPQINNINVKPNILFSQVVNSQSDKSNQNEHLPIITNTCTEARTETPNINKLEEMMAQLMCRLETMLNLITTIINKIA